MRYFLTVLFITAVSLVAHAGLELHTLRCSSNNLTLDLIFVANQNVAEATSPNAKGVFSFKANDERGYEILGGRSLIEYGYLAFENWPKGTSLRSYTIENKNLKRMNLNILSRSQLQSDLSKNKPLLYYYIGSPESLSEEVSFPRQKQVRWQSCEIDYDNSMDLEGSDDLASFSFDQLRQFLNCPRAGSREENSLIMSHGQAYRRQRPMSFCLNRIVNREVTKLGKSTRQMDREKIDAVVVELMEKASKSELNLR